MGLKNYVFQSFLTVCHNLLVKVAKVVQIKVYCPKRVLIGGSEFRNLIFNRHVIQQFEGKHWKTSENDVWTDVLAENNNSDILAILGHFNQLILGKRSSAIIVCTDYCNSRKKSENSCVRWLHLQKVSEIVIGDYFLLLKKH